MRAVIQRVKHASVVVDGQVTGKIEKGFLVFLGVGVGDTEAEADLLVKKISSMRIFEDEGGHINLNLNAVGGNILVVSQFTLYANCKKGNRPEFFSSADPESANKLYEYFLEKMRVGFPCLQCGVFGAYMQVELLNDGPFTIVLDTNELKRKE